MRTTHRFVDILRAIGTDDQGASAVIIAVVLVVILGLAAVAVDAGMLYSDRRAMQTAADAAALAGVQELPDDPASATVVAGDYASVNQPDATANTFEVKSTYASADTLQATVSNPARGLYFARFLGIETAPVSAKATAIVASPTAYGSGVMPFGIMSRDPAAATAFGYGFNESVVLKQGSQDGESGNFQFVALTDPPGGHYGASDIKNALRTGGVPNPVYRDEIYNTKTGMNGSNVTSSINQWIGTDSCDFADVAQVADDGTVQLVDDTCHRVIICPIIADPGPPLAYSWADINGSDDVLVIGFAHFFIEDVGTSGNECWIAGRFIKPVGDEKAIAWGPIDPYGSIGFRLVE